MSIDTVLTKKVERISGQIRTGKSKRDRRGSQNFSEELKKACGKRRDSKEQENTSEYIPSELIARRI